MAKRSNTNDIFKMSKSALSYAKERTAYLESEVERLFRGKAHPVVADPHPESGGKILKVRLPARIPDEFTHVSFDVLNHCRATLDRATHAIAEASGKGGNIKASFPIADQAAYLTGKRPESFRDIPAPIYNYILNLQPYEAGNYNLWALNKACNSQKHRMLVPAAITAKGFKITNITGIISEITHVLNGWDAEKNEIAVLILRPGQELNYDLNFTIQISFDKIDGIGSAPVIPVLYDAISMVEGILTGIEAEARRLKIID